MFLPLICSGDAYDGLPFSDSVLRLVPSLAWKLATLANAPTDLAWLVAGLLLAAIASR